MPPEAARAIFHLSLPASDLAATERFYCTHLRAMRGRATADWIDLIVFGHQITFHQRPEEVLPEDRQGVQHFGAILPWAEWEALSAGLVHAGLALELAPTIFAAGTEAEHGKLVLRDPSGHLLELKAYRDLTTVLPNT